MTIIHTTFSCKSTSKILIGTDVKYVNEIHIDWPRIGESQNGGKTSNANNEEIVMIKQWNKENDKTYCQ